MVPGINNWSSSWHDWPNRAAAYVNQKTDFKAQPMLYTADAMLGHIRHKALASQFCDMVRSYESAGCPLDVWCHSNGTRVVVEGLADAGWPTVGTLHLICGAVDGNFARTGLAQAIYNKKISRVKCYRAGMDMAMRAEDVMVGRWLFGIRTKDKPLGLIGPTCVPKELLDNRIVSDTVWPTYGHSECFWQENFMSTMGDLLGD